MTVYVDDARIAARVGNIRARWSHLTADSEDELHAFATRLGLRRAWFQDPCDPRKQLPAKPGSLAAEMWHYDVTDSKRQQAIQLGAQPTTTARSLEIVEARHRARQARRGGSPLTATFQPQAWINDCAVDVDADGPATWVVSTDLAARARAAVRGGGPAADLNFLADDPQAPAWVRAWSGPFRVDIDLENAPQQAADR